MAMKGTNLSGLSYAQTLRLSTPAGLSEHLSKRPRMPTKHTPHLRTLAGAKETQRVV